MEDSFLKTVYSQIENDLILGNVKVIAVDAKDFFIGYARDRKELNFIFQHPKLRGIITEINNHESTFYDLVKKSVHKNKVVLKERDIVGYETEQLLLTGGMDVDTLRNEILSNNEIVNSMIKVFSDKEEYVDLNEIYVEYNGVKDLPMFNSLSIKSNGLELRVTKNQISILTGCGLVKVHNTEKDIDSYFLAELVSDLFRTDKPVLQNVFNSIKTDK